MDDNNDNHYFSYQGNVKTRPAPPNSTVSVHVSTIKGSHVTVRMQVTKNLMWKLPVLNWTLTIRQVGGDSREEIMLAPRVFGPDESVITFMKIGEVNGLIPYTNYCISAVASNKMGPGPIGEEACFRTDSARVISAGLTGVTRQVDRSDVLAGLRLDTRQVDRSVVDLDLWIRYAFSDTTRTAVAEVGFLTIDCGRDVVSCGIQDVEYREGGEQFVNLSFNATGQRQQVLIIRNLRAFKEYMFEVCAVTDKGPGKCAEPVFTTPQAKPDQPPNITTCVLKAEDGVIAYDLKWELEQYSLNGIAKSYGLVVNVSELDDGKMKTVVNQTYSIVNLTSPTSAIKHDPLAQWELEQYSLNGIAKSYGLVVNVSELDDGKMKTVVNQTYSIVNLTSPTSAIKHDPLAQVSYNHKLIVEMRLNVSNAADTSEYSAVRICAIGE
eukprot:sb/3464819/